MAQPTLIEITLNLSCAISTGVGLVLLTGHRDLPTYLWLRSPTFILVYLEFWGSSSVCTCIYFTQNVVGFPPINQRHVGNDILVNVISKCCKLYFSMPCLTSPSIGQIWVSPTLPSLVSLHAHTVHGYIK